MVHTIAALRPGQWAHFLVLPASGLPDAAQGAEPTGLAWASVASAGSLALAYGVNAIADRSTDRSVRKNPLADGGAPPRMLYAALGACAVASCTAGAVLGPLALAATIASLACGLLYSVGPRLKGRPFAGLLCNTGIFVPLMLLLTERMSAQLAVLVLSFVSLIAQNQLLHELADAVEDAAAGDLTTARQLGERRTRAIVVLLSWPVGVSSVALGGVPLGLVALATHAAGGLVGAALPDPARARRAHRVVSLFGGAALWVTAMLARS